MINSNFYNKFSSFQEYVFVIFLSTCSIVIIYLAEIVSNKFVNPSKILAERIHKILSNYQKKLNFSADLTSSTFNTSILKFTNVSSETISFSNNSVDSLNSEKNDIFSLKLEEIQVLLSSQILPNGYSTVYYIKNYPGYVFVENIGSGMWGKIHIIIGFDIYQNKLMGLEILNHSETAGIGSKIEELNFRSNFIGLNYEDNIKAVKNKINDNEFEIITGATISSKSVEKIINDAIKYIKKL